MRVTAAAAIAVLVVLSGIGVAVVVLQRRTAVEGVDESVRARVATLAALAGDGRSTGRLVESGYDDDLVAQIIEPDGSVRATTANASPAAPIAPPATTTAVRITTASGLGDEDADYRLARRLADDGQESPTVAVGLPLDDVDETTRALVLALVVGVPGATALLAAVVWWLVGRALAPVEEIRSEVAAIGGRDLDRRVPEPAGDDEIGRLARTMNDMLARLQDARDRQDRFVADASHELRTPLTRMRSELEVDLAHAETADRETTERSVLEEVGSLEHLVDDLLLLARLDAARPRRPTPIALDEVVAAEVDALAPGTTTEVVVDATGPSPVVGDGEELRRVVRNLLANAVRHARSRVTVALRADAHQVTLVVADDGPGIPPTERDRVFERFTRLDDARSVDTGGAGLGLAIARELVVRHGGTIAVEDSPGGGAALVVRLPAARASDAEEI